MVLVSDVILIPDNSLEDAAAIVGRKAETRSILHQLKLPVPSAFVVTSSAFYRFLNYQNGLNKWRTILDNAQVFSPEAMVEISRNLQQLVKRHEFDPDLVEEIHQAYRHQLHNNWAHLTISPTPTTKAPVNVPLPIIKGEAALVDFLRQIWSAQLSPHSLSLQLMNKTKLIEQTPVLVSTHEKALVSGTITTIEPQTGNKNIIRIDAIYGTNPQTDHRQIASDVYLVDHQSKTVLSRQLSHQTTAIYADHFGHYRQTKIPAADQYQPKLTPEQIEYLATSANKIRTHQLAPQIINWLLTKSGILFTRFQPFEPVKTSPTHLTPPSSNQTKMTIIAKGLIASPGITTGPLIRPNTTTSSLVGKIVLLTQPEANLLRRIRQAAGIIIESSGITSDIAAAARDIGIPTLIGTGRLTQPDGAVIHLNAIKGFVAVDKTPPKPMAIPNQAKTKSAPPTFAATVATKIYLSINQLQDNNEAAYQQAAGVGELKGNDVVTAMGIHPKRLIDSHLDAFKAYLTQKLISASDRFGDRPVYYHPIDLETTKARLLQHGSVYEPIKESNSAFGFRGAYRTMIDPSVFNQELNLLADLRHKHQLKNLSLCLPLVRSVREYIKVKRYVSAVNLYRSPSFQLGVKIGTPAAAAFIPKLAEEGLDFVYIDLDLLALSVLGYDPDSSEVDQELTLINPVFYSNLSQLIHVADANRLPTIGFSYKLDQTSAVLDQVIRSGLSAICIHPPHFSQVRDWLVQAELKLINQKNHAQS